MPQIIPRRLIILHLLECILCIGCDVKQISTYLSDVQSSKKKKLLEEIIIVKSVFSPESIIKK